MSVKEKIKKLLKTIHLNKNGDPIHVEYTGLTHTVLTVEQLEEMRESGNYEFLDIISGVNVSKTEVLGGAVRMRYLNPLDYSVGIVLTKALSTQDSRRDIFVVFYKSIENGEASQQ